MTFSNVSRRSAPASTNRFPPTRALRLRHECPGFFFNDPPYIFQFNILILDGGFLLLQQLGLFFQFFVGLPQLFLLVLQPSFRSHQ